MRLRDVDLVDLRNRHLWKRPNTLSRPARGTALTDVVTSEISENLQSFGEYLRGFVEFRQRNPIPYPFYHCCLLCAQSAILEGSHNHIDVQTTECNYENI